LNVPQTSALYLLPPQAHFLHLRTHYLRPSRIFLSCIASWALSTIMHTQTFFSVHCMAHVFIETPACAIISMVDHMHLSVI